MSKKKRKDVWQYALEQTEKKIYVPTKFGNKPMTNETNEQKPINDYSKYSCNNDCDIKNGQCCHPDNCQKVLPPQEVEAKWTAKTFSLNDHLIYKGKVPMYNIQFMDQAVKIADQLNELDRLRSSMGKVPSDEHIEKVGKEVMGEWVYQSNYDEEFPPEVPEYSDSRKHERDIWIKGAKWMRSEVAPVIAGLEEEKKYWEKEADDYCNDYVREKQHCATLVGELKQAKEALKYLYERADNEFIPEKEHELITALLAPKKD